MNIYIVNHKVLGVIGYLVAVPLAVIAYIGLFIAFIVTLLIFSVPVWLPMLIIYLIIK